jgi:hypothetical protein
VTRTYPRTLPPSSLFLNPTPSHSLKCLPPSLTFNRTPQIPPFPSLPLPQSYSSSDAEARSTSTALNGQDCSVQLRITKPPHREQVTCVKVCQSVSKCVKVCQISRNTVKPLPLDPCHREESALATRRHTHTHTTHTHTHTHTHTCLWHRSNLVSVASVYAGGMNLANTRESKRQMKRFVLCVLSLRVCARAHARAFVCMCARVCMCKVYRFIYPMCTLHTARRSVCVCEFQDLTQRGTKGRGAGRAGRAGRAWWTT